MANEKLERIAAKEDLREDFIIHMKDAIIWDEETPRKKFAQLKRAYDENPAIVNDLMMTLCGWSFDTLIEQFTEKNPQTKFEQILSRLNDEQKRLFADTIIHGAWGDTDTIFKGETEAVSVYGYITDLAYKGNHFERKSLSNRFKDLFKALGLEGNGREKQNDTMQWMYDWWGDGSGSILLIREDMTDEIEEWANNYNG